MPLKFSLFYSHGTPHTNFTSRSDKTVESIFLQSTNALAYTVITMPIRVPAKTTGDKAGLKQHKRTTKSLKRKRDNDELEQLDKSANEFVRILCIHCL